MNLNELLKKSQEFHNKFLEDNKEQIAKLQKNAQEVLEQTKTEREKLLKKTMDMQKNIRN